MRCPFCCVWDGVDEDHPRIAFADLPVFAELWSNSQDERSEVVVTNPPSPTNKKEFQTTDKPHCKNNSSLNSTKLLAAFSLTM